MSSSPSALGLTFAVLAVAAATFAVLQSLVAPALPDIQRDLDASATSVTWVLTAYLLSASILTPIIGRLGDMFGKERMLVYALAMLSAGTLLAALATNIDVLIAARVIQGGGGAIFPLAFGIIRDEFPRERVSRLANRVGSRVPLVLGSLSTCLAFVFLAAAHGRPWEFYVGAAILGVGIGLAFASLANLIVEAVPPEQTGVATGMNTVMRSLGGSVGSQVGASVIAGTVVGGALPTEHGFTVAFIVAASACGLAALASRAVPRRGRPAERATASLVADAA